MQKKLFIGMQKNLFVMLGLLLPAFASAESWVSVHRMQQQEMVQVASKLGKMLLSNGNLQVLSIHGDTIAVVPIGDEGVTIKIGGKSVVLDSLDIPVVDDNQPTDLTNAATTTLHIYPNPTTDMFHITGLAKGSILRLYTMSGNEVMTATATEDAIILPVEALPAGQYVLIVNNQFFKLIKQ